jgi:ribonuclease BN (tRNA processing enzyme)
VSLIEKYKSKYDIIAYMGEEARIPAFLSKQSQIIFLGTGSGKSVRGKQLRATGGIVLQTLGYQFLIDPGPGATAMAANYGINLRDTAAILVTHNHLGHANDLNAVIDAMTYSGLDKHGVLIASKSVIEGDEFGKPYLREYFGTLLERIIALDKHQKAAIDEIEIHGLQANHTDMTAIGFKIITPDFTLVYTGDTEYTPGLAENYKGSDIIILNVTNPNGIKDSLNLCCKDAALILEKAKPNLAIITHFGLKMIQADPLFEAREIQKQSGVQVIAAKDGMNITPGSFALRKDQKTLNGF